jgi:hypothetical protein
MLPLPATGKYDVLYLALMLEKKGPITTETSNRMNTEIIKDASIFSNRNGTN